MKPRTLVACAAAGTLAAASLAPAALGAAAANPKLTLAFGSGFTINVSGAAKTKNKTNAKISVKPGKHDFSWNDNSTFHNFHLSKGSKNAFSTSVSGTGKGKKTVNLTKGTWKLVCDPHVGAGMVVTITVK